jgi:ATP-dependent DNA helicase RecQ
VRSAGGGPTLVVLSLLALVGDQVAASERAGLHAATLNSNNIPRTSVEGMASVAGPLAADARAPDWLVAGLE